MISHTSWIVGLITCAAYGLSPVFAQEEETDSKPIKKVEAKTPKSTQDGTKNKAVIDADKPIKKAQRLSIQKGLTLKLQQGPGIGKPLSILPRPFVPKGSVNIPKPNQVLSVEQQNTGVTIQDQNPQGSLKITDQQQPIKQDAALLQTNDLSVQQDNLIALDPSTIGVETAGVSDFPRDFWQGKSRSEIIKNYHDFAVTGGSQTLKDLSRSIVLSAVALPQPKDGSTDVIDFLQARLSIMEKRGDDVGVRGLINRLPTTNDWNLFDQQKSKIALADDKRAVACSIAENRIGTTRDPYWLRLLTFCSAINNKRETVDFQNSVLEEIGALSPAYFNLIDHILIEAETGVAAAYVPEITTPLNVQILEAAMVNIARAKASQLSMDDIDPMAVPLILKAPGVVPSAKIELIEKTVSTGAISANVLADFIMRFEPTDAQLQAAAVFVKSLDAPKPVSDNEDAADQITDLGFIADIALANAVAKGETIADRMAALSAARRLSSYRGNSHIMAAVYLKLMQDVNPNADTVAYSGLMIRMALLIGNNDLATAWFNELRTVSAGKNLRADQALQSVYPLMALAGFDIALSDHVTNIWWQAQQNNDRRYEQASLLATVMESLEIPVSDQLWKTLSLGPVVLNGKAASPAQWRNLLIASNKGDKQALLTQARHLIGTAGIKNIPIALTGSLVGSLKQNGYDNLSHRLALEILILGGL